jgi:hypothetical protein
MSRRRVNARSRAPLDRTVTLEPIASRSLDCVAIGRPRVRTRSVRAGWFRLSRLDANRSFLCAQECRGGRKADLLQLISAPRNPVARLGRTVTRQAWFVEVPLNARSQP